MTDENEKVEETTPEVKEKNLTSECHCETSSYLSFSRRRAQHSEAREACDNPSSASGSSSKRKSSVRA
jgi:hypothetical protein